LVDLELLKMAAFPAANTTLQLFASEITMPNLTIQVRNNAWTKNPEDAQKAFDMLATKEKERSGLRTPPTASGTATTTLEGIRRKSLPSSRSI
jgi:hypothetical protein